jgi:PAS domain S-box-containing protein
MERTRPEVTGAFGLGNELPMTAEGAEVARAALASSGALLAGPAHERQVKPEFTEGLGVRSSMLMALHPKGDQPYLFGVHQCSRPRTWTPDERRLFEEIGHRIGAALTSFIALRGLRESEQRLEEAQRVAHLGYWDRDLAANRVVLSEESWRIFGVEPHERPADLAEWTRRWEAFIHPEDRPRVLAAVQAALGGGPRYDVEFRILRKDGDVRVLHVQGDVIRDAAGRAVRMFGTQQDITALRQSEHRLQAAQRIARVGWWERDYRTNKVSLSDETCRIFGVQPLDLPQWHGRWLSLIHPEDRARVAAASEAALRGGTRYDVEYRILRPDGTVRVVHSQGDITRDESGRALRQFGVMQDITELWQAQQELRSRQDMLDLAQKAARAVAFDWHIGERESENRWSPDLEAMYGLEPGTFDRTYRGWKKLVHPDDWPAVKLAIERAQESGDVAAEYRVIHKDGSVHWLQAKGRMFFDAGRRPERMVGFMIDVTDRRRAEEELRATEARFRTFVDHATDAFFLLDAELTVIDVNRQACQSLGYRREELIGMRPRDFDAALDQTSIARFAERAEAGETVTFETLHRRKDGDVFPVEIRAGTFLQGGRRFHLSLARDIRERKRAEEALRESDHALQRARAELAHVSRVMTMGELTASIAHEVNQPLGAMVANAAACSRWLAAKPPETAKARRALESIAADGRRASEVIGRIRSLMKRQTPRKESLQINVQIRQVIALAEYELRRNQIVLRTQLADALPCVEGDSVQLQQVLLNLIVNAIEAMSEIRDRPRELTVVSRREGSNAVVAEVRDSGTGLEPGRAERLFQAFYTTKPEGMGIGLSISRSIVEAHGGRLWAEPNAPRGAVFRFSLPVEA